jgi:hypothetical protein
MPHGSRVNILFLIKHMEAAANEKPVFPPRLCFETPTGTKSGAKAYTIFVGASTVLIVAVISLAVTTGGFPLPVLSASIIACLLTAFTAIGSWRWMLSRLRFCVVFHEDHLQVGRGLAKRRFSYQEVDIIYLPTLQTVKVRSKRRTAAVFLTPKDALASVLVLRRRCPNAVLVDVGTGSHLLPTHPIDPERTLKQLEGHYRRRTLIGAIALCYLIWITVAVIRGLTLWQNGNVLLKVLLQDLLIEFLVGFVLITFGVTVWRLWHMARAVRQTRLDAAARGVLPGDVSGTSPLNNDESDEGKIL